MKKLLMACVVLMGLMSVQVFADTQQAADQQAVASHQDATVGAFCVPPMNDNC